jgi:hypothetical protein
MEMYYGDETLGSLIKHSKQVIEDIKEFEDIYTLTNEGLEKMKNKNNAKSKKEKSIFYTRS